MGIADERARWLLSHQDFLSAHGVRYIRAYECCDVGRTARVDGRVVATLHPPPPELWTHILGTIDEVETVRGLLWEQRGEECVCHVNSGYRSPQYNRAVGGVSRSRHTYAEYRALDVWYAVRSTGERIPIPDVLRLFEASPRAGSLGLGRYPRFIHVDTRGWRARWTGR